MTNSEFRASFEVRTKDFAVRVFKFLDALPKKISSQVIAYQLAKSASSVGANYREATRAESRDDFGHKLQIALKESSETGEIAALRAASRICGSHEGSSAPFGAVCLG